jgi:hypothetical protein
MSDSQWITRRTPRGSLDQQVRCGVERITRADQAYAVAAAAAHDFNDELTVILSSVYSSITALEPGHPARPHLLDLQDAAQRCALKSSGLLSFGLSCGGRATRGPMEKLLPAG